MKGICSPASLGPDPGEIQLDSAALLCQSYEMELSSLTFQFLQCFKKYLIFLNEHRNIEYLH